MSDGQHSSHFTVGTKQWWFFTLLSVVALACTSCNSSAPSQGTTVHPPHVTQAARMPLTDSAPPQLDVTPTVPIPPPRGALVNSTPTLMSTPTTPRSYEAESSQNTRGSGTFVVDCSFCSGGQRVGDIWTYPTYYLQFNNVWEPSTSNYTLTIYYIISGQDGFSLSMSVNGEPETTFNVPHIAHDTLGSDSVTVNLQAGDNTIEFSCHSEKYWGPDLDRIVV